MSIDDTKGIFKALSNGKLNSIFETRTISFLKEMNMKYNTIVTMYCSCTDEEFNICDVAEKYRNEFMRESSWLMFGFHCFNENENMRNQNLKKFVSNYNYFNEQILRIAGQTRTVDIIRLHGFSASKEICVYLREHNIKILLSSDDNRLNYYLNDDDNSFLLSNSYFYDNRTDINFIKSCKRLESVDDVVDEMNTRKVHEDKLIPVFTHEWQMDNPEIRKKFEICCKWGADNCGS